jgi:glycosyltransferase involved in cell wall biosynthesis
MPLGAEVLVSVITPCWDNPKELAATLASIRSQRFRFLDGQTNQLILIDASSSSRCQQQVELERRELERSCWRVDWLPRPALGIYDAFNAGLERAEGAWLHVLPAGDRYADLSSLERLFRHARALGAVRGMAPPAVFGQAWIELPGSGLCWRSPDPQVRSIKTWLRWMVPCHQSLLFNTAWARANPYDPISATYGDRPVMRAALADDPAAAYLAEPVCRFRLDGHSSALPDGETLQRRLADPALDRRGRRAERFKALLGRLIPSATYGNIMRFRAAWLGWRC